MSSCSTTFISSQDSTVGSTTMGNTSRILQRLYSLDASSPEFLRLLHCLIQYDEEERYSTNLEGPEVMRLVDFLDKVRAIPSTLHRSRDRPLQALDMLPINNDVARECLKKLHAICADRGAFPSSHILSSELVRTETYVINTSGGYQRGTYRGKKVDIISLDRRGPRKKVRTQYCVSSQRCSQISSGAAGVRRFDLCAQNAKSPEHSPSHWRDDGSFAGCCGAGKSGGGAPQQTPRSESDRSGKLSPVYQAKPMTMTLPSFKLLEVAEAFNFIHTNGFLTRIFTGVGVIFRPYRVL